MHTDADVLALVDYWTPLLVRACAETGVFAAVGPQPLPRADVAARCGIHDDTLARVVRALVPRGIFVRRQDDVVELGELGRRFVPGTPGSAAGYANFKAGELHAWAEFLHTLRTGEPGFPAFADRPYFDWLAADPARARQFNDTMRRRTSAILDVALDRIEWPDGAAVVDVGGGNGLLLERLLRHRPGLRGVVFDLPHVVDEARELLRAAALDERTVFVAGSFFDRVPADGDLYVLSNVLHDWDDRDAGTILTRCREAMGPQARLRLLEAVLTDDVQPRLDELLDLHMLTLLGGRERTAQEWVALLASNGFAMRRVVETPAFSWIEAAPS